ncbi:zinc fingers and homeoboxes protein 2 [Hyla sarda]|uniref:zinc fingers and homeoboxes protein 2 n=1 Tax=Hyla sarda TaxID=327740 RepID=UPI0024C3650F|nr:zinc fingers and homeoboxes protein 2 [Hyla sarda]XP_056378668.1 zinc fingers and homeoboxes protein 2 [Hyla sarda]
MASKRKSTTPCMVRATELVDQEDQDIDELTNAPVPDSETKNDWPGEKEKEAEDKVKVEEKPPAETQSKKLQGGYECKYCPYVTQNLNEFTEHVDMQHPNVILNPLYVCAECNFTTKKYDSLSDHNSKHHPGESNFKLKLMKRNNQTILEQSIEGGADVSSTQENMETDDSLNGVSINKLPISKLGKSRAEMRRLRKAEEAMYDGHFGLSETNGISGDGLTHVMPSVQLPPNINLLPKVPVPLNSNKYNSALDTNVTLITSFNKFPYPTQAELSWLTAASKHPEEQIRIWFATQRLKHGISWSPEEVEEARKKMFNGTIQSVPQSFTVVSAPITTTAKVAQPIIQTAVPCQFLGQTGLVFTQVTNTPTVTVSSYSGNSSGAPSPSQKRSLQSPQEAPEPKRQNTVKASSPSSRLSMVSSSRHERKKTNEQIAILKASFVNSQFPDDVEVYRLIEITGLSRSEIKKWFSDYRYRSQRGICNITSETLLRDQMSSRGRRPYHYRDITPTKLAEITEEQLQFLEISFQKSSFPTQSEFDILRAETKLSRRQIHYWFMNRRKVRDSMEQAVLDSMGSDSNDGLMNGASTQSGNLSRSWSQSSVTHRSKQEQLHLLKSTFARTQWPTPREYDQLAEQTGLVRTEIVKWFKDNRCVLRNGSLRWMEQYRKMYERSLEERKKFIKITSATSTGRDILTKYFQEYGQLHEEDVDLLMNRAKLDVDELRACFSEMQEQGTFSLLNNEQDDDKLDLESEAKSHGDDEVISDGEDSWSQTGQDNQDDMGDYEYGSTPKDDSCA